MSKLVLKGNFTKIDKKHKVCYGWAYVCEKGETTIVDHSGDTWPIEELEKTAHEFVIGCRVGKELHSGTEKAVLVESLVFTEEVQKALGIDLGKCGWFVGFRILDEEVLEKIATGEYAMFSIGGNGNRDVIEE